MYIIFLLVIRHKILFWIKREKSTEWLDCKVLAISSFGIASTKVGNPGDGLFLNLYRYMYFMTLHDLSRCVKYSWERWWPILTA